MEIFFQSVATGQYILDGKRVGIVRLVDWLDGQCGQVGQVIGMLESSSQDDISNTGLNGDCILRYECHFVENKAKSI